MRAARKRDVLLKPFISDWCGDSTGLTTQCRSMPLYFASLTTEERKVKYPESIRSHVLPWSLSERLRLEHEVVPAALRLLDEQSCLPWASAVLAESHIQLVRTAPSIEFNLPFTLCKHAVFLPSVPSASTLAHELVHILQRIIPDWFHNLYLNMGWVVLPPSVKAVIDNSTVGASTIAVHNPDSFDTPVYALQDMQNQFWLTTMKYKMDEKQPHDVVFSATEDASNSCLKQLPSVDPKVSTSKWTIVPVHDAVFRATRPKRRRVSSASGKPTLVDTSHAWTMVHDVHSKLGLLDLHPNEVLAYASVSKR